jgi:hypothetical protein
MTTRRDVSLNVLADISKYQAQFAKIPGYTDKQAAKAAERLEKRMSKAAADSARAAQRAAQKSARAFEQAGSGPRGLAASLDDVAEKSGDIDSIIAGLGGALGAIDPKLQAVATGFSDAAGGLEAVSKAGVLSIPAMGAVGVAVAALGAAYLVLAHDVEEAEKAQEAAAKRAAAAAGAFNGFTASIRALDVEVSKLVGSYDEIEEASKKRERAFQRQAVQAERFLTKEIEATKVEQDRLRALQRSGDASDETTAALQRANQRLTAQSTQLSAVRDRTERFRLENELLTETLQERKAEEEAAKIAAEELKQADEAAARAADRRAEAEAKQKQEIDALVAAGKARAAQVDRDIDLQRQNAAIVQQTTAVELSAMGRLAKATEDQLAKAEQVRQQRIENAAGDRFLELQAEQQFQETKTVLTSEYERQRTELLRAETLERQRLAEEEHQRSLQNLATFSTTTLGALNSTLAGMSQLAADAKSKEQARDLFMAAKVTGIGLALTNTAVAATKALSQLGAFGGPVAAAAITAAGLVQVETIRRQKPPAFYRGTSDVQPASGGADAVPAILHQGEAVLNRRAADSMGRGNIDDMNAGRRRGSPPVVAISQINHRQFRDFYRDDRSLPGSLTRRDRNRNGTKIGRQL